MLTHIATVYRQDTKNSRPQKRTQLVGRWVRVKGQLVCQWVPKERSFLEE